MSEVVAPTKKVTFTVTQAPTRLADQKTLHRLMRMQRPMQNALRRLSHRRAKHDNFARQRAGRMWVVRVQMTKLTKVETGEKFTLTVTPQIMADIKSVQKYLDAKPAK
jgi:hypothetical protein